MKRVERMTKKAKILVIDDEHIMRESCETILLDQGYEVELAENGIVGLRLLQSILPDLILVDLKMPGMDGMELLEKIHAFDSSMVTIVITGYATIESAVKAMKRGAYDFLPKPFTPDELRIILRRGLEKRWLSLQLEMQQKEKETLRENFIALVMHELRTPLVSIQQYYEVLHGDIAGELTTDQKEILDRFGERIGGLMDLITRWLDFYRMESEKIKEKFKSVNLVTVLNHAAGQLKSLAEEKGITLRLEMPTVLPEISGDEGTLEEVFSNLVTNGIKFNHKGGSVKISVQEKGSHVIVQVSDTGIGISEENLPYIFDAFFRVKCKETLHASGNGLGLAIVKKIVEAHSGTIKVESRIGEGTQFTVALPVCGEEM